MNNVQKKELARYLYVSGGFSQTEISGKIGVSEQTISRWKITGKWDDFKKSMLATRREELKRLYDQLKELNDFIANRPEGERFANSKEADTITKLTAAIRNLETELSLSQVIDTFIKFNNYMRQVDLEKAQELISYQDHFVKSLLG